MADTFSSRIVPADDKDRATRRAFMGAGIAAGAAEALTLYCTEAVFGAVPVDWEAQEAKSAAMSRTEITSASIFFINILSSKNFL
jgi:hypothetical protein